MKMKLLEQLHEFVPYNKQEDADLPVLINTVHEDNAFFRSSLLYHFSASSWIVNHDRTKVLMCFHFFTTNTFIFKNIIGFMSLKL